MSVVPISVAGEKILKFGIFNGFCKQLLFFPLKPPALHLMVDIKHSLLAII